MALFYKGLENNGRKVDFANELRVFCLSLKKYDDLAPKKRIKKIFVATKSAYLKNYSLKAKFSEIDRSDTYNCVTGSALFSIIFDELDIPYTVVEVPRHVYLVAYPNSYGIGVESTNLKDGIYYWTEFNKRQAVSFLIAIGEVTEQEVKFKGIDAVIEDIFYSNSQLDFDALVGLYYFNRSLYSLDEEDYKTALSFIEASVELYKNERNNYMMRSILSGLIRQAEFDNIDIVDYITLYYHLSDKKSERDRMEATFNYVYQEALYTRRDFDFTDSSVKLVEKNLTVQEEKDFFLSQTSLIKATWHVNRRDFRAALDEARIGYGLNPDNFQFHDLITMLIIEDALATEPDPEEFRDSLVNYGNQFPFIWENDNFRNFSILFYAYGISDAFLFNQSEEGYSLLAELTPLLERGEFSAASETAEDVAEAYSQIATYHYRKKEYDKALEWIKKAETLDPDSDLIKTRGDQIRLKAK